MKALRLRGFRLESLISRGLRSGLQMKTVCRSAPREMLVVSPGADADRLQAMAREKGIACEEAGRSGWDRLIERISARRTLAAGILLAGALVYLFSGRIWRVDILPEEGLLSEDAVRQVRAVLEEMDISPGCRPPDTQLLARALAAGCPDLAHVGVKITGVRLLVSGVQADPAPEVYDPLAARDLVAQRDGVVMEINVLAGQAAVQPGDTVKAGDVLIAGWERISDEETRGVRALGEVTARVWTEARASAPLQETVTRRTGRTRTATALVGPGVYIPLTRCEPFSQCEAERTQMQVVGMFLPVYVEKYTYSETQSVTRTRDAQELAAQLSRQAEAAACQQAPGEILRVWSRQTEENGQMQVRSIVESAAQIAGSR